jgi:hypothetical protein
MEPRALFARRSFLVGSTLSCNPGFSPPAHAHTLSLASTVDHRYCRYNGKFTLKGSQFYWYTEDNDRCAPTIAYDGTSVWSTVQPGNARTVWKIKSIAGGQVLITPASGKKGYLTPSTTPSYDKWGDLDTSSSVTMKVMKKKSYWRLYEYTDEPNCLLIDLVSETKSSLGWTGIGVSYDYSGDCTGRVPFNYVSDDPAQWSLTPV